MPHRSGWIARCTRSERSPGAEGERGRSVMPALGVLPVRLVPPVHRVPQVPPARSSS